MERLTFYDGGIARWRAGRTVCSGKVADRLAAYEDTGLEPEEVLKIRNAMAEVAEGYNCLFDFVVRCVLEAASEKPNAPLTLEELREMDGEPVYIHWTGCAQCTGRGWAFVHTKWGGCKMADGAVAFFDRYGETWVAYRRKPEKVAK